MRPGENFALAMRPRLKSFSTLGKSAMHPVIEGMVISAAVSIAISSVVLGIFSRESSRRYTGALGYAAGFLAAFAYLHHRDPTLRWSWLPWLALVAAFVGPIAINSGIGALERVVLGAIFSLAAGWFLVPINESLRVAYVVGFAGIMVVHWNLLDRLTQKASGMPLWSALAATSVSAAALVAYAFSVKNGSIGAVATAAMVGGGLSAIWKQEFTIVRGMVASSCVVLCGILLAARLYEALTYLTIALLLISPLMLWLFEFGPLSRLQGVRAHLAKIAAVGLPHIVAWSLTWTGLPA